MEYFGQRTKDLNHINSALSKLSNEMPTEIHRAVRDLSTLHFWKATEFHNFLLYLGIIALKDVIPVIEYEHFMLLSIAIKLCSSDAYKSLIHNTDLLERLLDDYIEKYINIYGEHTISSNVHNLCHLIEDVKRFGNLNTISTYPFENLLHTIKLKLRSMKKALEQISRRMGEIFALVDSDVYISNDGQSSHSPELKFPNQNDRTKFRTVVFNEYRLSSLKFGDKWFLDKNHRIIEFIYATKTNGVILLHGYERFNKADAFTQPFLSSKMNIYKVIHNEPTDYNEVTSKFEDIKCKMVCTSFESGYICQPLLHTLR